MADRLSDILNQAASSGITDRETNSILRRVDEKLAEEDAAFKAAVEVNKSIPAADQAKALPIAKEKNLPVDVVRRNLRDLEEEKTRDRFFSIMERKGSVGKLAADPAHGPIATEHADELDEFERMLNSYKGDGVLKTLAKGMAQSTADIGLGTAQFGAATGAMSNPWGAPGQNYLGVLNPAGSAASMAFSAIYSAIDPLFQDSEPTSTKEASQAVTKLSKEVEEAIAYQPMTDLQRDIIDTFSKGEIGRSLANIPGFAAEQFIVGLPYMFTAVVAPALSQVANTGRVAQDRAGNDGRDFVTNEDLAAATPVAALITFGERFGFGRMMRPGTGLMAPVRGGLAEGGTETLQEAAEYTGATLGTEKGFELAEAGKAGLGGFIGGAPAGAVVAAGKATLDAYVLRAEKRQKDLVDLGDKIRKSKVGALSPDTLTALAKQIDADGGPAMTAPADKLVELFQSEGLTAEQVQEQFPEVARALDDAVQGSAEIPLNAETIVKLVGLENFEAISGDVRTGPNERTPNELKQDTADFDAFVESLSDTEKKEAVRASIEDQLTKQLTAAGQDPRAAAVQARLWSSILTNIDERNVKDPGATLARHRLDIANSSSADIAALGDNAVMMQSAKAAGYGEPAIRINGQVLKASDFFPNWERGSRPEAGREPMSIADEQAMGDVDLGPGMPEDPFWGHANLLAKAREAFGNEVVDAAIESDPEAGFGMVNAAGDFRSLKAPTRSAIDPQDPNILLQSAPPKAPTAQDLIMVAKRGERAIAKKAEITPEEEPRITAAAEFSGLSEDEIRDQIIKHKRAHPEKQGWAPLVFKKIRKDEASDGTFKLMYEYDEVPYAFNTLGDGKSLEPGTPDYTKRVKAIGKGMAEEVRSVLRRARAGDKNAQNILAQAGWYKAMRSRLRQEFGGLGDLFADLLGATSPNTPVRENWKNAVDSLRRASRGDFDELIEKWVDWADNVNALELDFKAFVNQKLEEFEALKADRDQRQEAAVARREEARRIYKEEQRALGRLTPDIVKDDAYKAIGANEIAALRQEASEYTKKALFNSPEYNQRLEALQAARKEIENLLPTKETGSKYGFNGRNVANAMINLWRVVKNEDPDIKRGGTKPKAINFSGNLIGFRNRATIDVWAARMLQRLAGFLRIPSMAEGGVSGDMREDGTTTLQFGFGQDVFSDAVARIRKDPEMNQDPTLAAINDDDLQAVVWFVEKELWTVNGWTSVAGEGGSFELEANLTGPKDQARINELRRIIDSSAETNKQQKIIDDQTEIKKQQKILESKKATDADKVKAAAAIAKIEEKKEKARQKLIEVEAQKEEARKELAASERTVDRFVGGLSIQMSKDTQGVDFVPTDADMEQLGNRIRTAIYETDNGATVLASKSLSSEGRYGSVERSIDLEVVAREGYDPKALWLRMLREAQEFRQDSTFLSRVLREGEQVDYLRHRPGVEIYFQDAAAQKQLEQVLADLAKEGVQFLTVVVDGRRMPGYTEGSMPPAVGVRLQYVPEFEQRYGMDDLSSLDDAALAAKIEAKGDEMAALAERVAANVPGVSFAGRFWYETEVAFASTYQEKIDALTAGNPQGAAEAVGGPKWTGQPIRQGLEDADRHVRETSSGEPGGQPGGVLDRDAEGVGADGNQTLYQLGSERTGDGAGRYSSGSLAPLQGAPTVEGASGPDPKLVSVAEQYARDNGIPLRRQAAYVQVDPDQARRIAAAYEAMAHAPQDPAVREAYDNLIRQTRAQYDALVAAGYEFTFFDGATDPYGGNPWNAMRDLRANKRMAVYGTYDGFGTEGITANAADDNPMLQDTGLRWKDQSGVEHPVTANDLFRAVHDAFGHGLEGAGFRAQGEENAWQAHVRLFTGSAVAALTSETRGQNSWLNFGPYGEQNRTARVEDTVFAENKAGLMPPWTWEEGRAADEAPETGPSSSQTLDQTSQATQTLARGFIKFGPKRDHFQITLTGKADLSTFNHEMMHYALEVIQDLVQKGEASPQLVADLQKLREFAGLKDGQPIERRHHEQIARAWEAYVMEGRSPSADLQGVFNRMRAWMVFIYKRLAALDVELTDEVRGVFDRLVASDAQIAEARTQIGWSKPLPKEALFLSDDEYDRYVEAWNKASEAQQREVDAKLMLEAARETQAAWKEERAKVMEEEREKLAQTRGYRAWKLLSEGTGLADAAPGRTSLKIDPESVPAEWRRDTTGMTDEIGLPLEAVAEILGFDSGEQMISLIAGAKFAERDLPAKVKQIMAERHGDMDATALADAAMAAVHSDDTQEVLLTEFRAMAAKAGIQAAPPGLSKWMAAQAQQKVLGLTRRQLDPMRWRRAELKAATDAAKAAAKGDATKAAIHKRQQMMAAAMFKATTDAQKRVDVIRRKLMPFTKNDRRAKLGKAGDLYLDGIDQILEDIQLKPMSAASIKKLDRLQKLVEAADKNGEPLVLPDKLRAMLGKKNFADMTLEELEGVHDAVMNIWHLAKLKNELKARQEKRDLEEALTEMEENARRALGDPKVQVLFTKGWKDRAAARMRAFRAGLVKMEFLFGWLDGRPDGGLMHRLIYQPIADANKAKYDILKRFQNTIIERMRDMPKDQKARWESKRTFMGNPTANGATIIATALNLGNEGNKQKLLEGYGWNEQRLMAEINAFMTKADWDFVQHVWNEIDTLWPDIVRVTKAATGLEPEKVVASPIVTPFGTYAGGYYPVAYDPEQTEQQFKNQQESAGLFTNNYARPTLGDGFTKARVDYAAPILLDLSVISRHLAEVVHYVTHYEAITQADKITRHPRFQAVVKGHMGNEFYRTIRPWLQDVARDQDTPAITNQEPFAKAMRHLRGGVSIAAMGYNIFTGVKQLIGVVQSLDAVGPKYWLSGLSKAWLSPNAIANWKFAFKNSQELEPLVTQLDRDIKMINDAYAMEGTLNMPARVASWAFKHIGWLQAAVNVATWHGAYEQDLARNGGDHEKAVMHADAVVRMTQSAGAVKDLSPIQRGSEINRAVSMFYSWFNVLYNRLEDIARQTKSIRDVPKATARVAILVMMSSMIEEAGRRAYEAIVDNYEDDEEEPGYILSVLLKSVDTAIGAIPLARVFFSAQAASGGMTPDLVPAAGVVDDYWRTARAAYDLVVEGEAPSRSEVKTAVRTVSILGAVPLSGPYNFLDEMFGETVFGEGKKTKP